MLHNIILINKNVTQYNINKLIIYLCKHTYLIHNENFKIIKTNVGINYNYTIKVRYYIYYGNLFNHIHTEINKLKLKVVFKNNQDSTLYEYNNIVDEMRTH